MFEAPESVGFWGSWSIDSFEVKLFVRPTMSCLFWDDDWIWRSFHMILLHAVLSPYLTVLTSFSYMNWLGLLLPDDLTISDHLKQPRMNLNSVLPSWITSRTPFGGASWEIPGSGPTGLKNGKNMMGESPANHVWLPETNVNFFQDCMPCEHAIVWSRYWMTLRFWMPLFLSNFKRFDKIDPALFFLFNHTVS